MKRSKVMADNEATGVIGDAPQKKKRNVNRGARGPKEIYVFAKLDAQTGKISPQAVAFRDPRKMAQRLTAEKQDGEELIVVTPE